MQGRRLLIWPDHDDKGRKAAEAAAAACCEAGATEVRVVEIPDTFPDKWDLADPVPDDQPPEVLDRLRRDAKVFQVAKVAGSNGQGSGLPLPPEPLTRPADEVVEYPLDALPELVRDAVRDYQDYGQQPFSMIACRTRCGPAEGRAPQAGRAAKTRRVSAASRASATRCGPAEGRAPRAGRAAKTRRVSAAGRASATRCGPAEGRAPWAGRAARTRCGPAEGRAPRAGRVSGTR